jgi:pimeloyl-ACP methyl ester carboxylesterase
MVGRIAHLELELAEGVGHMPQFAEPERTEAFIRRIAARAFAG